MPGGSCAIYRRICVGTVSRRAESLFYHGLAGMIELYLLGTDYPFDLISRSPNEVCTEWQKLNHCYIASSFLGPSGIVQAGQRVG